MKKTITIVVILIILFLGFENKIFAEVDIWTFTEEPLTKVHTYETETKCNAERDKFLSQPLRQNAGPCILSKTTGYPIIETKPIENTPEITPIPVTPKTKNKPNWETYTLLAPFAGFEKAPDNVGDYLNKIFIIGIALCGALAVLMIIIAGVQYMGEESISGKGKWREQLKNALYGLLIALSAYALLNTIDPRLLGGGGVNIKSVSIEIDPEVHGDTPHTAVNGKYCNGKYSENTEWPSDSKERDLVKKAGITINKNNCTKVGQSDCTSLAGLNTSSVINLKKVCPNCEIVITGGTECWLHSSKTQHLPGNSIVDLRTTTSLISYVENSNTPVKATGMNFPVFIKNSTKFMKEPNHYHIVNW